jgi:hypothetical protein
MLSFSSSFIRARLHMDALSCIRIVRQLRESLVALPCDLSLIYDSAMDRIRNQSPPDAELALRILSFVTHLRRPLTVPEFQHLLAFSDDDSRVDFDEDDLLRCGDILSFCAGIVIHDVASNTIRLVHFTTGEYFRGVGSSIFNRPDSLIATLSLQYL